MLKDFRKLPLRKSGNLFNFSRFLLQQLAVPADIAFFHRGGEGHVAEDDGGKPEEIDRGKGGQLEGRSQRGEGEDGDKGDPGEDAEPYVLPAATTETLGGVKQAAAVADAAAAPTQGEFNALLASLRAAGILAASE